MINCYLNLEYKAKGRTVSFLDKLQTHLGTELLNRTIKKHPETEGWFEATFQIAQCDESKETAVYDFLRLIQLIENRAWFVHGPREMEKIFIDAFLDDTNDHQPLKTAYLQIELPNRVPGSDWLPGSTPPSGQVTHR